MSELLATAVPVKGEVNSSPHWELTAGARENAWPRNAPASAAKTLAAAESRQGFNGEEWSQCKRICSAQRQTARIAVGRLFASNLAESRSATYICYTNEKLKNSRDCRRDLQQERIEAHIVPLLCLQPRVKSCGSKRLPRAQSEQSSHKLESLKRGKKKTQASNTSQTKPKEKTLPDRTHREPRPQK